MQKTFHDLPKALFSLVIISILIKSGSADELPKFEQIVTRLVSVPLLVDASTVERSGFDLRQFRFGHSELSGLNNKENKENLYLGGVEVDCGTMAFLWYFHEDMLQGITVDFTVENCTQEEMIDKFFALFTNKKMFFTAIDSIVIPTRIDPENGFPLVGWKTNENQYVVLHLNETGSQINRLQFRVIDTRGSVSLNKVLVSPLDDGIPDAFRKVPSDVLNVIQKYNR